MFSYSGLLGMLLQTPLTLSADGSVCAIPVFVHVCDAPIFRKPIEQMNPTLLSLTKTLTRFSPPSLVTMYVHVTVSPGLTSGGGGLPAVPGLSTPLVSFLIVICGVGGGGGLQ